MHHPSAAFKYDVPSRVLSYRVVPPVILKVSGWCFANVDDLGSDVVKPPLRDAPRFPSVVRSQQEVCRWQRCWRSLNVPTLDH